MQEKTLEKLIANLLTNLIYYRYNIDQIFRTFVSTVKNNKFAGCQYNLKKSSINRITRTSPTCFYTLISLAMKVFNKQKEMLQYSSEMMRLDKEKRLSGKNKKKYEIRYQIETLTEKRDMLKEEIFGTCLDESFKSIVFQLKRLIGENI